MQPVSTHTVSTMTARNTLDEGQYARNEILKYEAIYGRDFVSPGGGETAARFVRMLDLAPGARVLDAGCGLGGSAFRMACEHEARVVGVDLSSNMIDMARERCAEHGLEERVRFVHADVLELDSESEFDAVYSRDAFLHVHDKLRLFTVLHRALKPGGRLLTTDYCAGVPPWSMGFTAYVRERGYDLPTVDGYSALIALVGFTAVCGVDITDDFLAIHEAELARLPSADLSPADQDALAEGWRAKIARIRGGEQRWGLFTAHRAYAA